MSSGELSTEWTAHCDGCGCERKLESVVQLNADQAKTVVAETAGWRFKQYGDVSVELCGECLEHGKLLAAAMAREQGLK